MSDDSLQACRDIYGVEHGARMRALDDEREFRRKALQRDCVRLAIGVVETIALVVIAVMAVLR